MDQRTNTHSYIGNDACDSKSLLEVKGSKKEELVRQGRTFRNLNVLNGKINHTVIERGWDVQYKTPP